MAADVEIKVIKGDSVNVTVTLVGLDSETVDHIYFSSRNIITKELIFEEATEDYPNGLYRLSITAAETAVFPIGRSTYDITVYFTNNSVQTVRYKGPIMVYEKDNRVDV